MISARCIDDCQQTAGNRQQPATHEIIAVPLTLLVSSAYCSFQLEEIENRFI